MDAEQVEARKIADRIEMGRALFLRRQVEDKEKQDMLNASLHEQLARGRERRTAEARDRLYAAHPDPARAIPMGRTFDPDQEVHEKRKLKAFLDTQVQARAASEGKQADAELQQHKFVLQCLQEELMRDINAAHKAKLQGRQMISNEWDRQRTLGQTQLSLGFHKVH